MSFTLTTLAIVGGSVALASAGTKLGMSLAGRKKRIAEQKEARKEMEKRMSEYENLDTSNLSANVRNQFANMENTYEDMTVNQQQAEFIAQQGMQQRANIMQNLRGAAGGSGIAALAQAMANQGQLAAQQASASIGAQEARIQQLQAGEASKLQTLERKGEQYAQAQRLAGAERSRGLEYSKTGTLLGMSQQRLGAANQARAQAKAQQMSAVGDIGKVGLSAVGFAGKMAGGGGNALSKLAGGAAASGSTGGGYNPYEVEMDYQQMIDRPISVSDPNPPELTSLNIPGAGDYSGGFNRVFNPATGKYE